MRMRRLQELYAWGIIKYDIPKLMDIARPFLEIYKKEGKHIFIRPKKEFARVVITGDHKKSEGLVILTLECFADPISMLKRYLTFLEIDHEVNLRFNALFLRGQYICGSMLIFNSLQDLQESIEQYYKEVLSC